MTLNLTPQYYATTRDFAVVDTEPADVAAIETVFAADWSNSMISPPHGPISFGAPVLSPRSSISSDRFAAASSSRTRRWTTVHHCAARAAARRGVRSRSS